MGEVKMNFSSWRSADLGCSAAEHHPENNSYRDEIKSDGGQDSGQAPDDEGSEGLDHQIGGGSDGHPAG